MPRTGYPHPYLSRSLSKLRLSGHSLNVECSVSGPFNRRKLWAADRASCGNLLNDTVWTPLPSGSLAD